MIAVGGEYSDPLSCRNLNIPFILISAGVCNILAAVTNAGITFVKVQDVRLAVRFISAMILLMIYLWASIMTYSSYRTVQHNDPSQDNYCNALLFRFTFVLVLVFWCFYLIFAIGLAVLMCVRWRRGQAVIKDDDDSEIEA